MWGPSSPRQRSPRHRGNEGPQHRNRRVRTSAVPRHDPIDADPTREGERLPNIPACEAKTAGNLRRSGCEGEVVGARNRCELAAEGDLHVKAQPVGTTRAQAKRALGSQIRQVHGIDGNAVSDRLGKDCAARQRLRNRHWIRSGRATGCPSPDRQSALQILERKGLGPPLRVSAPVMLTCALQPS